jgi:hypothetical protein
MKPQEIGLNHEALKEFVWNVDSALQAVTKTMMRKGLQSGTVNAKIDIVIQEVQKEDGEIVKLMVIEPDVKLKIGSKERFKCQTVGTLYAQIDGNGVAIAGDNQISMEEYMNDQKGA